MPLSLRSNLLNNSIDVVAAGKIAYDAGIHDIDFITFRLKRYERNISKDQKRKKSFIEIHFNEIEEKENNHLTQAHCHIHFRRHMLIHHIYVVIESWTVYKSMESNIRIRSYLYTYIKEMVEHDKRIRLPLSLPENLSVYEKINREIPSESTTYKYIDEYETLSIPAIQVDRQKNTPENQFQIWISENKKI